jgi:hypothetical protein
MHFSLVALDLFEGGQALSRLGQVLFPAEDAAREVLLTEVEAAKVELALNKVANI